MENYSLSDLAAATNGGGGFGGGNSAWVLIILFALIFGWGGFGGNRNGDFGNFATAASQSEIIIGQRFDALGQKINAIGDGICSSTYALNNTINGVQTNLGAAINSEGRALQSQLAQCCCNQQANTDSVRYDMANFAAQINSNLDNKFAALEKNTLEQRIADQAAQIQQLQLQSQLCGIVRYPMANVYTAGNSPFCNCACNNI